METGTRNAARDLKTKQILRNAFEEEDFKYFFRSTTLVKVTLHVKGNTSVKTEVILNY